jgi:hypothetical protein
MMSVANPTPVLAGVLLAAMVRILAQAQTPPVNDEPNSTNALTAPKRLWSAEARYENDTFGGTYFF